MRKTRNGSSTNAGDTCLQQNFWDIWFNQGSFKGFGAPPSETQIQKAQVELAENYYLGDRVVKNYKSAYDLFLRASKGDLTQANFRLGLMNHYGQGKEKDLIKNVLEFPKVIQEAAKSFNPSLIANYIFELVKEYNSYYQSTSILKAEADSIVIFRVLLSKRISTNIKSGMSLLGIDVPERM